ncbi:Nn.00g022360.m01.CDS01 [Neocucurbitaria sp. VM-36]
MTPPILQDVRGMSPSVALRIDTDVLPSPLSLTVSDYRSSRDDEHETKLQQCWDKSIAKHMDLPNGYHNVHVLMIKWQDEIDQLDVRQEVDDLTSVFKDTFNFDVSEVQLGASKSQLQLEMEINTWAYKHDSPDNLLIVYYAGHGVYNTINEVLQFTPTNEIDTGPRVIWNEAEKPFIQTVQGDVFSIMDCCYASDLLRNVPEYGRTFETLCASHIGLPTAQPGENSFTRCLINTLKDLAVESSSSFFTTRCIQERMQKARADHAPALWRRIPGNSRHIRLSKLKPLNERPKKNKEIPSHARFLHLGFALKNEFFHETHIEALTKKLPELFASGGVPLVDIKWLGCRKVGNTTLREVVEFVVKNRGELSAISPASGIKRNAEKAGLDEGNETIAVCGKRQI